MAERLGVNAPGHEKYGITMYGEVGDTGKFVIGNTALSAADEIYRTQLGLGVGQPWPRTEIDFMERVIGHISFSTGKHGSARGRVNLLPAATSRVIDSGGEVAYLICDSDGIGSEIMPFPLTKKDMIQLIMIQLAVHEALESLRDQS